MSPETRASIQKILIEQREQWRHLQDTMPAFHCVDNIYIQTERTTDGLRLSWKNGNVRIGPDYTVNITKVAGLVEPIAFQGGSELIEMTGDGAYVDRDVKEGWPYLYSFCILTEDVPDGVIEASIPAWIPMSSKTFEWFTRPEAIPPSPAQKSVRAAEEFVEMEEAMDEAKKRAVKKIRDNPDLSPAEKDARVARIEGHFRAARSGMRS
jgi:hypothetical protein